MLAMYLRVIDSGRGWREYPCLVVWLSLRLCLRLPMSCHFSIHDTILNLTPFWRLDICHAQG